MAGGLGLRELGGTGLKISSLGFGGSPLGNLFGSVKEEDAIASVHEAARLGINFFDVSPFYGDTLAETVLGKALKSIPIPREDYVLSTKCGRYASGFDFSAERVTKSVDESLQRLNVTYVDLIHCHDIEFGSLDQIVTETVPALQKLKDAGKVRHIGISGLPLNAFRYVLDRVPKGSVEVVLSYCHYSLNDTSLLEIVPYLQEKGIGIISASPLSMGLLSGQTPPEWHPAPSELKVLVSHLVLLQLRLLYIHIFHECAISLYL
jgi:L-galactose dehydrogenase